ncbi:MAG: SET domain-containing protein [Gammaproteobacteria bacterium]|jgi:SET domain-containing protein
MITECNEFSFILKPSPIRKVGVFATHDIPAGTRVFADFSPRKMKIKDVPAEFRSYCVFINKDECSCPERFDRMEIVWYINHSDKPNVTKTPEPYRLVTTRDIRAGEEILINFNEYNEPEHLKESYYK